MGEHEVIPHRVPWVFSGGIRIDLVDAIEQV